MYLYTQLERIWFHLRQKCFEMDHFNHSISSKMSEATYFKISQL